MLFADTGRIFSEQESFGFNNFNSDLGFGFRWMTPIAPFRFEWAYPYDTEKQVLGDLKFIFTLGY